MKKIEYEKQYSLAVLIIGTLSEACYSQFQSSPETVISKLIIYFPSSKSSRKCEKTASGNLCAP
ncbi:hypothetical protein AGR7C_Cc110387 [Agrobacterium deltaense Zutra 3/1]|uniref:Uncharacterized protein n=1 Tax=Agrobacterium deltaense Zutra 3/1 TaxID=1183427 RepID=A0A1S7P564_9HYPH|nr:hypothetical protein AGR7C_Cc110387 [Agrobacterium deltaense Zutra 3/1]